MKTSFAYLLVCLISFELSSQNYYPAPKFEFSGTKVLWHQRPIENCTDTSYWIPVHCYDKMYQYLPHIIYENKVYYLLDNEGQYTNAGSTLICYDLMTGDSLWQINYNGNSSTLNEIPFRYRHGFKLGEFGIELLGFGSFTAFYKSKPASFDWGFMSKRVISIKDGSDLEHVFNTNFSESYANYFNLPSPIIPRNKQYFYYRTTGSAFLDPSYHHYFRPRILNDTFAPTSYDEKSVGFKGTYDFSKINPAVIMNDSTYIYFASFPASNPKTFKHFMWKVNYKGDAWDYQDVSTLIGGTEQKDWIVDIVKVGDKIRLKITKPYPGFDTINGHQGYLFIDYEGNTIKDQRAMVIDGKPVGHIISTTLLKTKDILHVIRFINEDNIYFYLEKEDGSFVKVGELIYDNPSIYAFLPRFIVQDHDGDLVLTFDAELIHIPDGNDFQYGGWQFICKISGNDLTIPTATNNYVSDKINISPNPVSDFLNIRFEQPTTGKFNIYNNIGQLVLNNKFNNTNSINLNVGNLSNGNYNITLLTEKQVLNDKFIKIK